MTESLYSGNRPMLRVMLAWGVAVLVSTASSAAAEKLPSVPAGFTIERVAAFPLVKHPMMAGFDDRGRLFVAASAGHNMRAPELEADPPNFIQMLEDTDGDGRFDRSTVFADKMTLPMGALWYRGALYVASPPNIWRLEDTDDDGVADRRDILVDKFGFSGNAASVHGCFLGPNGRIYWCDGRHGHEFTDEDGNVTSRGKAARIFSCLPDGNDVQVFCGGGMDNPVEIDFTATGEMLGSVNILLSQPRVDCLMHWVDGGVYPRHDQEECLTEFRRTGDLLPPMTQFGHVAVSGMMRYRSGEFGPEYTGNVFTTVFNTGRVVRSVVQRSGATFTTTEEDFFVSANPDCHPTDVLDDADGSLLVIDTGGWFRIGCPTSQVAKPEIHGAIYRIRREGAHRISDPRGQELQLHKRSPAELIPLLTDARPAVQEQAVDRLGQLGLASVDPLLQVLKRQHDAGRTVTGRVNAVWALSRIQPEASPATMLAALDDDAEEVLLAAARSFGTNRDAFAVERLSELVVSQSPAVRREAATALGRICEPRTSRSARRIPRPGEPGGSEVSPADRQFALEALFTSVSQPAVDRVLEHALIYAAIRIADRDATIGFLQHENPKVRRAALMALDQMEGGNLTRELVTPLLDTDDPELQTATLEIISRHEGWAGETLALLQRWLTGGELAGDRAAVVRGFLLAQVRDPQVQQLVGRTLADAAATEPVRLLMLEIMQRATVDGFPSAWKPVLQTALRSSSANVRVQAVGVIQTHALTEFDAELMKLAGRASEGNQTRVAAITAVAPRRTTPPDREMFQFLLTRLAAEEDALDRLAAARAVAELPLSDPQLLQLADQFAAAGPLATPVLLRAFARSSSAETGRKLISSLKHSEAAGNLSPDELARIVGGYPADVAREADSLLKQLGVDTAAQAARLTELAPLASGGDADRGRAHFFGKKAACSGCHTVEGRGGKVGPDLTQIGRIRTHRDLLEAVVFPSASFARGFRSYMIVTTDGRLHTGIISRETADTVVLRTAELSEVRIPRSSIDDMRESPVSIMPKGLDRTLTPDELRDLLAFLQSLKTAPSAQAVNQ